MAWLAGMLASGLPGLARRFNGLARGVASRSAEFTGAVARFDRGLTIFARFAP